MSNQDREASQEEEVDLSDDEEEGEEICFDENQLNFVVVKDINDLVQFLLFLIANSLKKFSRYFQIKTIYHTNSTL